MSLEPLISKYCFEWTAPTLAYQGNTNATKCHINLGFFLFDVFNFTNHEHPYICSVFNEIIHIFLKYLRCSITIHLSTEAFGGTLTNGNWTGILSFIQTKKVDFIPVLFVCPDDRWRLIDCSFLYSVEPQHILSYPKAISTNDSVRQLFSNTFSANIWLAIFASFFAFTLINGIQANSNKTPGKWLISAIKVFAILVGQGGAFLSRANYLIFWSLMAFIIRNLFSTDLTAILLLQPKLRFNTIRQLFDYKANIIVEANSPNFRLFQGAYPEQTHFLTQIPKNALLSRDSIEMIIKENAVIIAESNEIEMLQQEYKWKLHKSTDRVRISYSNFAIRKSANSQLKELLKSTIKKAFYFGIVSRIKATASVPVRLTLQSSHLQQKNRQNSNNQKVIKKERKLSSNFSLTMTKIYLTGVAGAGGVFICELITFWCSKLDWKSQLKNFLFYL